MNEIARRHGAPVTNRMRDNYKKQATQVRVCILQAKEYFDAARASSIFTSPNHCYYGAVALASVMMLILGDGRKSLDYLRVDNKNCHHGLDFNTGCNASAAASAISLLEQSYAKVMPFGQFANWYGVLPEKGAVAGLIKRLGQGHTQISREGIGTYSVDEFDAISGSNFRMIDLLKYLPDLGDDLDRFGMDVVRSRSSAEVYIDEMGNMTYQWAIHSCRPSSRVDELLHGFSCPSRFYDNFEFYGVEGGDSGIVKFKTMSGEYSGLKWPDTRETMNHDVIAYAESIGRHEIVDLYIVAYQLSMLSRYFPDIWIACIESQCRAAKIVERVVDVFVKKFPILALSVISGDETIISTHRPPWQS
ncbi:YaaC family protein [Burkholderia cepacia]|uniref:YaaC family protein n=1 Tax=Burkholderia cepacia TaxID=292 RepID=UPI002AB15972|nr:hypothetical protein [Burkholderia cepacia]